MRWLRRVVRAVLVVGLLELGATLHASEGPVCGDGVIAKDEPCDVASTEQRCPSGYGCIRRHDGRCKCARSCESTRPTDAAFDTADKRAEAEVGGAWGSAEQWERYWRIVETEIGCSVHAGGERATSSFMSRKQRR